MTCPRPHSKDIAEHELPRRRDPCVFGHPQPALPALVLKPALRGRPSLSSVVLTRGWAGGGSARRVWGRGGHCPTPDSRGRRAGAGGEKEEGLPAGWWWWGESEATAVRGAESRSLQSTPFASSPREAPRSSTSGRIPGIIALVSTNPSFSLVRSPARKIQAGNRNSFLSSHQ